MISNIDLDVSLTGCAGSAERDLEPSNVQAVQSLMFMTIARRSHTTREVCGPPCCPAPNIRVVADICTDDSKYVAKEY